MIQTSQDRKQYYTVHATPGKKQEMTGKHLQQIR